MNSLLLEALQCRNPSRPPIWLMRQAGRYMASYRALRAKYSFLEMCHNPDLICQVTQLPVEQFDMDAAILFSDILVVVEAMGRGLRFEENLGPIIERPIENLKDIDAIGAPDITKLKYVEEGIKLLRPQLKVPLIGFCGAPFTVASYMIEGKTSRELKKTKQWMLSHPEEFHRLLRKIADWTIPYLDMQVQAGVQALQIFDSWANSLAHHQFREFSLYYLDYMLKGIRNQSIPVILFCRGSSVFARDLAEIKPACISLDWNCNLSSMRKEVPSTIALQGNLDPSILLAPPKTIKEEAKRLLDSMKQDRGYIFNLGHGITPDVPEDAVKVLVESVKGRS